MLTKDNPQHPTVTLVCVACSGCITSEILHCRFWCFLVCLVDVLSRPVSPSYTPAHLHLFDKTVQTSSRNRLQTWLFLSCVPARVSGAPLTLSGVPAAAWKDISRSTFCRGHPDLPSQVSGLSPADEFSSPVAGSQLSTAQSCRTHWEFQLLLSDSNSFWA